MPAPRLLVMEGNSPETRAQHVAAGGTVASKGYAALLQELLPERGRRHLLSRRSGRQPAQRCRRSKAMTASPSPARGCTSTTTVPEVTRQIELVRAVLARRHAGVRKLLGPAGAHGRRRRRGAQEPEGPRDRLRPPHQADRARPQASDVCRQARGVQRADRASRRGRDHRARHHGARHQRSVRRAERGNPRQRRDRLGRAVSSGISAPRDRHHRPPHRRRA